MPLEAIKALQFEKTKDTLERAYHKSPFYRDLFDKAKVKPERFRKLEDIARFPFIDKQDLVKDQKENPPFGRRVCVEADWVWIESPRGRIMQKCELFEGIDRRVVHVQHGWRYAEEEGADPSLHGVWKSNCNVLTNDDADICNPVSGGWPLRTLLCRVYKVQLP